jgi:hypothetical protein
MAIKVSGTTVIDDSRDIQNVGIITATQLSNAILVNYSEKVNALGNTGASKTINVEDGNYVTATLDQSTTFTFTSPASGKVYGFSLFLTNGSGGPYSITWPNSIKWPNNTTPVRTTAANKSDIWVFSTADGGTTWYGYIGIYDFS